jgi:hypothetical protein
MTSPPSSAAFPPSIDVNSNSSSSSNLAEMPMGHFAAPHGLESSAANRRRAPRRGVEHDVSAPVSPADDHISPRRTDESLRSQDVSSRRHSDSILRHGGRERRRPHVHFIGAPMSSSIMEDETTTTSGPRSGVASQSFDPTTRADPATSPGLGSSQSKPKSAIKRRGSTATPLGGESHRRVTLAFNDSRHSATVSPRARSRSNRVSPRAATQPLPLAVVARRPEPKSARQTRWRPAADGIFSNTPAFSFVSDALTAEVRRSRKGTVAEAGELSEEHDRSSSSSVSASSDAVTTSTPSAVALSRAAVDASRLTPSSRGGMGSPATANASSDFPAAWLQAPPFAMSEVDDPSMCSTLLPVNSRRPTLALVSGTATPETTMPPAARDRQHPWRQLKHYKRRHAAEEEDDSAVDMRRWGLNTAPTTYGVDDDEEGGGVEPQKGPDAAEDDDERTRWRGS